MTTNLDNLHPRRCSRLFAIGIVLFGCADPELRKARDAEDRRTRIATESARAAATRGESPAAGVWTPALVTRRLVDAGLAPQRRDSARSAPWFHVPVHALTLGLARVDAYIFADSTARMAATAGIDPLTLAVSGQASPYGPLRGAVSNGNLFAVVVGGTDRQRDRILTALAAGIGAP